MILLICFRRRVREYNLDNIVGFSELTDEELDQKVSTYCQTHGLAVGRSMIMGYLKSEGIRIQQRRVTESLVRVDPIGSKMRWSLVIKRRKYNVPAPNSLWHIDGHHSLINWGFVIHGGIDGFSRLITYLRCSTNNFAETVNALFYEAIDNYGLPSRVRSDKGGENILVWQSMINLRGENRRSYLAGSSVHNQRIERLWRDVWSYVCCEFYYTFQAMEDEGIIFYLFIGVWEIFQEVEDTLRRTF